MKLPVKTVDEFRQIYEKEHKQKISYAEAERLAMGLLRLFSAIYKPIKQDDYEKLVSN
jgi:hypothetical protein